MSDNIEQFTDGTAAFFSARVDAWHRLGTVTTDCLTAEDAMKTAHLDWTVEKRPLLAVIPGATEITEDGVTTTPDTTIEVPGKYATVRLHPETGAPDALGVVGEAYQIVQNLENAQFLNNLVDESGAHFETAGSLRNGRQTFVSMKLPDHMLVGGSDVVDTYLTATNSHDGSSAFTVVVTPIRVVCANTLAVALKNNSGKIKIRHTSGATGRIEEARRTLNLSFGYLAEFEAAAEAMLAKKVTERQFTALLKKVLPQSKDSKGEPTKGVTERDNTLMDLFLNAETNEFGRGTAWGAFNAVTEWADWYLYSASDDSRAQRTANGVLDNYKHKAFALLS
jgi:phage/plasmid-like protein (TIGR03299 family)